MEKTKAISEMYKLWENIGTEFPQVNIELEIELYKKLLEIVQVGPSYFFLFNPSIRKVEYVSDKVTPVLGIPTYEFTLEYMLKNMHPDDLNFMADYEASVVAFKSKLAKDKLTKYKSRYNYRLLNNNGDYVHIIQQSITVAVAEDDKVLLNLVFHTDVSEIMEFKRLKLSFIGLEGEPSYLNIDSKATFSKKNEVLSKREIEVLKLLVEGNRSEDIAEILHRSVHTIRNHRKNMLSKTGCVNVQELLVKALRKGWI